MAGVFAEWQPAYAEVGIATFPVDLVDGRKCPAVGNYLRAGKPASREWARKFPDADALGFACGARSGLTVLDLDSPCENLLADCLSRFGQSPVIARTPSGNHHVYYLHGGEGRKIRTLLPGEPVDLLGGGYAIAPPSRFAEKGYSFIAGTLGDLASLPRMTLAIAKDAIDPVPSDAPRGSGRNDALFNACLVAAQECASANSLLEYALAFNAADVSPLPVDEVARTASSAWRYQDGGSNFKGKGRTLLVSFDHIDAMRTAPCAPDALWLLGQLQRVNWHRRHFACANAMHERLGWTLPRFKMARKFLLETGLLVLVEKDRPNFAAEYRFGNLVPPMGEQGSRGRGV